MEKRIELEKRGRDPKTITELNLDNCRTPNIAGLTDEFVNLETLSLMNVGLTSLKGFPKLPNLRKLELSENRISNGLHVLQSSPKLTELNLSGNKIKDLETLEPLKEFKNLKSLDISNTEASEIDNYREKVFSLIPQLKYLDGYDAENHASDDSEVDDEELNGNGEEASVDGEDEVEDDEDEDGDEEGVDEEDEGEEGEAEEEDDDDIGLSAVYKDNLDEESEGDDYDGEVEGEDEEDGIEDEESENDGEGEKEESIVRGKKRKHEEEDEGE
ncbi:hypothetical protein PGB90_007512 [Kerria lacca]